MNILKSDITVESRIHQPEDYQSHWETSEYEEKKTLEYNSFQVNKNNKISYIWDELEMLLEEDKDFEIVDREGENLILKAKKLSSFHNSIIMGKILGNVLPFNCELNLKVQNIRADTPQEDKFKYQFKIDAERGLYYEGSILVKRE